MIKIFLSIPLEQPEFGTDACPLCNHLTLSNQILPLEDGCFEFTCKECGTEWQNDFDNS